MIKIQLPESMTREQEKEAVMEFYKVLPDDSYLKIILRGVPEYCEEQIRNDWTINPVETIANLKEDLRIRDDRVKYLVQDLEKTQTNVIQLQKLNEDYKAQNEKNSKALDKALHEVATQKNVIQTEKLTVQQLKARLYDFVVTEGEKKYV